eukprot:gene8765-9701_t
MFSLLTILVFMLSLVQAKPMKLAELARRNKRMPSPEVLESKASIVEGPALIRMTKDMLDPDQKDINVTRLMEKLGRNFDSTFMSVKPPRRMMRQYQGLSVRTASIKSMPRRIQQLKFEIKKGDKRRGRVLGSRASMKLRQWLWELSRCPIKHTWVDYGAKVFPRYIKYGRCMQKPCSFPAGLTCQPRDTRTLRLLIWVCPQNAINSCRWHPFSLSVLTSCKCACER